MDPELSSSGERAVQDESGDTIMLDNGRIYSHIDVAFDPLYKRICAHCDEISPTRLKYCVQNCAVLRPCLPAVALAVCSQARL